MPFELLVEMLRPERNLKHTPLFQVKLVLQNMPLDALELPGLTLRPLPVDFVASKFDLTLLVGESDAGLSGNFEYNTDLFDAATVRRMAGLLAVLLERAVSEPDARVETLKGRLAEVDKKEQAVERTKRDELSRKRLMSIRPKGVGVAEASLVRKEALRPGAAMPLVVTPRNPEVDILGWAKNNGAAVEADLRKHGALLFRGFRVDPLAHFEQFAGRLCKELFVENGEHPRGVVSGKVYTPVFYPPDQHLLWHNENSFNHRWPTKIMFACVTPAAEGGETPIADSRLVFEQIDPAARERFLEKGVMYVRNYDGALGLDWRTVFQTDDRAEVEEACRRSGMEFEWKTNDRLRTRCVRPAAVRHPATGEMSWFNQAQHWHVSCLDPATRESLSALFREEDLPRHCYYGDGSPIEDSAMAGILDVYRRVEVSFPWQRGDIFVLDNLLAAHARNRFVGERKLLVAMGDMLTYDDV
jgi:alpha-ketoglutarate-dependent taurine dioxygenase